MLSPSSKISDYEAWIKTSSDNEWSKTMKSQPFDMLTVFTTTSD